LGAGGCPASTAAGAALRLPPPPGQMSTGPSAGFAGLSDSSKPSSSSSGKGRKVLTGKASEAATALLAAEPPAFKPATSGLDGEGEEPAGGHGDEAVAWQGEDAVGGQGDEPGVPAPMLISPVSPDKTEVSTLSTASSLASASERARLELATSEAASPLGEPTLAMAAMPALLPELLAALPGCRASILGEAAASDCADDPELRRSGGHLGWGLRLCCGAAGTPLERTLFLPMSLMMRVSLGSCLLSRSRCCFEKSAANSAGVVAPDAP